jgi:glycosyltransferase involved in cell wall biosynthesis
MIQIPKFRSKTKSYSVALLGVFGISVITPVRGDPTYSNANGNLHYLPFAYESPDFDKNYVPEGVVRILSVGKFQERKNQLRLVQAVETLLKKHTVHLTLVGVDDEEIYTKKLLDYIAEHNLSQHVTIRMNIPWEDMTQIFRDHDVFVLPSYNESAAVVIVEAMVNKLPVLSSNANGTHCYVEQGKNGYSFDPQSVEDLTQKLEAVIANNNTIVQMGSQSFAIARRDHSPSRFYTDFMKVLKRHD